MALQVSETVNNTLNGHILQPLIWVELYRVSQKKKPATVMKGEMKDRHNTLIYFKSNLYERLF